MILENGNEVAEPVKNRLEGSPKLVDSTIEFKGEGNIVYAEDGVTIEGSRICFPGDNGLLYLSKDKKHPYKLVLDIWGDSTIYFGKNSYFNGTFTAIASERKNIIVGRNCVFSFGIWARTADPHLLYDGGTGERINLPKSILIGDHVWIGQDALILKGTKLGSGSVLAARSVISGKGAGSNTVYAGDPAVKVRENVFFTGESTHGYTEKQTAKAMKKSSEGRIFQPGEELELDDIDQKLKDAGSAEARLKVLQDILAGDEAKNRFYI